MGPLGPLLMYVVFGLPDSTEQWSRHSPFGPVESGGEASPGGKKSARGGGENRPHSTGNQPTQPINQPGRDDGSAANSVSDFLQ
jgi:hypothetical protein